MVYGIEKVAGLAGAYVNRVKRWTDIGLITPEVASERGRGRPRLYSLWNVFEAAIAERLARIPTSENTIEFVLSELQRPIESYSGPARLRQEDSVSWRDIAEADRNWMEANMPMLALLFEPRWDDYPEAPYIRLGNGEELVQPLQRFVNHLEHGHFVNLAAVLRTVERNAGTTLAPRTSGNKK